MTARLPGIKYSEKTPTGEIGAVRAPTRVSTGAEYIAAGIESLGSAFEKVSERYDNAELSTMKRQLDESTFAFFNTYSQTGSEQQRKELTDLWSRNVEGIRSNSNRVNAEFQKHKNVVMPEWGKAIAQQELKIKNRQTDDAYKINMDSALERNDLKAYSDMIDERVSSNRISQAEGDYLKTNAPVDSKLARGAKMIYAGDSAGGLKELDSIDADTLSEEKAKYYHQLKSAGKQGLTEHLSAIENDITLNLHNNRSKSGSERLSLGEEQLAKLNQIKDVLPAPRYDAMMKEIEGFEKGKDKIFDPITYVGLLQQVEQLHNGIGNPATIRSNITQAYPQLDDTHFDSISKLAEEKIATYYSDTISRLHKEATPLLAPHMMMTERLMQAEAEATTPEMKKSLHDELNKIMTGNQMKTDAMRIALYMDQVHQHLRDNPNEPDLHLAAQKILFKFEKYTDPQIRQMQTQVEQGIRQATGGKTWRYLIENDRGQRMGRDNPGDKWTPIP